MIFNSDHPSRCGENRLYLTSESTRSGSSPRTRGKPKQPSRNLTAYRDHPRGRGENRVYYDTHTCSMGSPPQVRGKLGKTAEIRHRRQDHPRRCGENGLNLQTCHHMIGSPPQVRGKHDTTVPAVRQYRITPAGAGKTRHGRTDSGCHRDHPRRCGENISAVRLIASLQGSPPQVRGKP